MTRKREATRRIDRRSKSQDFAIGTVVTSSDSTTDTTIPSVIEPTGLVLVRAVLIQNYQSAYPSITVEWDQPESAQPDYYTVEWSTDSTFITEVFTADTTDTQLTFISIADTVLYVRVKSVVGNTSSDWSDTLTVYSPQDTTSIIYTKPAGGADSILLDGLHEFALSPELVTDSDGHTPNAIYNMLVSGSIPAKTDIQYTTENHLSKLKTIKNVVIPIHWFTRTDTSDYGTIKPGIAYRARIKLAYNSDWAVSSYTSATAHQFPSTITSVYGTSDDNAFIRGARYFNQKGYSIGISPIVCFIDFTKTQELEIETARGEVQWSSSNLITSWITQYKTFVLYYVDLLLSYGITPSIVYLASEMNWLSQSAYKFQWLEAIQYLADQIKARNTAILTTYAAAYDEYSYRQTDFQLDPLWTYNTIDTIGVQWFQPLQLEHSNYPARSTSQENYEFTASGLVNTERYAQTSSNIGKRNVAQTALDNGWASKNVEEFLRGAHYTPSGSLVGASPLQGDWRSSRSIVSDLAGNAITTRISTLPIKTYGMRPSPAQRDTWLTLDGAKYGSFTMPDYVAASGIASYNLDIDFRYYGGSSVTPHLIRGSGVINIYVESSGLRAAITKQDGSTFYSAAIPLTSGSDYKVRYEVSTPYSTHSKMVEYLNGAQYQHTSLSGQAQMPISSGIWYVGAYDASNHYFNGRLYYTKLEGVRAVGKNIGGIFYFDDSYAGVRTSWLPEFKPIIATAVGYASINGAAIEPHTRIALVSGQAYTLPSGLRAKVSYWDNLVPSGLSVSNIYGPYGSSFNEDQNQQALALQTTVDYLRANLFKSITIDNMDIRPPETLLVGVSGQLWYKDGPKRLLNHNITNKRAGGN